MSTARARPRRSAAVAAREALSSGAPAWQLAMLTAAETRPRGADASRVSTRKRGRADVAESDGSSLSSLSDDEGLDGEAPTEKRLRGRAHAATPVRAGGAEAAVTRVDVAALGDNELFNAVLDPQLALEDACENWVVQYQTEPADALAQLVTFVLRLCGSGAAVDKDTVVDTGRADDVVEELSTQSAQYPIVSRTKAMRHARRNAEALLDRLLRDAAEAEILSDDLLDPLAAWTVALSASALRAFRHTATTTALWVIDTVSSLLDDVRSDHDIAVRQRDAEARRAGANRPRLAHTAQKIEQLDALRDSLDGCVNDLVSRCVSADTALTRSVFVPRSRDFDAAIRRDCVVMLGVWMREFGARYLQEFYFRHLGSALADPVRPTGVRHSPQDVSVRIHALRAVQGVNMAAHAALWQPFADTYTRRLVDMALYDMDMDVRTAAFGVLEQLDKHGMLGHDDRAALAIHVFDMDRRIRAAAGAFLAGLLDSDVAALAPSAEDEDVVRTRALLRLLVKYDEQLQAAEAERARTSDERPCPAELPELPQGLGRLSVALEALWDASAKLRVWRPWLDLILADRGADAAAETAATELGPAEEAAAVELAVAAIRMTHALPATGEEASPMEACSTALMTALPGLLSKYASDAPRIADLLTVPQYMDLDVYQESRNLSAFESLWEDMCTHFLRHIEPALLLNAARTMQRLASATIAAGTSESKLLALQESVLASLQDTLHQRSIETAVFSENDVHNLQASLARLHALLKVMDASSILDAAPHPSAPQQWEPVMALARRGRLAYDQERSFVELALSTLTLYVLWRTKALLVDMAHVTAVDTLVTRRDDLLSLLAEYLGSTASPSLTLPWQSAALHNLLLLHTLFYSVNAAADDGDGGGSTDDAAVERRTLTERLFLPCADAVQQRCADVLQRELEFYVPMYRAEDTAEQRKGKKRRAPRLPSEHSPQLLSTDVLVNSLVSAFTAGVRAGMLDVRYTAAMLRYYAQFNSGFDAMCLELVSVLRDDGLHADRAWVVCETILDAMERSFALFLLYADDTTEAHFVSLSRQLASATLLRGPGFTVLKAIDANAMVTLHVAACQRFLQYLTEDSAREGKAPVFFKGMANLLATVTPADAMKIHSTLQQRLSAANVEPTASEKSWDPYFAYERRLLNLAAKDATIVSEANHYDATPASPLSAT
ncbi:cohesin complex subunit [Malassezia sp. CBS 17886]|nr:cohesin complex subunit [Malassezia sp. CBS 17886]